MRAKALRRPSPDELHEAFLWSATRTADKTAAISLFGNHYEIDAALASTKVELLFDPFDLADIEVRYQGRPMGTAVPRRIRHHTHPQATPDTTAPPKASGIDYLGLVAQRVAAESARRIAYAGMGSAVSAGSHGRSDDDDGRSDDDNNNDDDDNDRDEGIDR